MKIYVSRRDENVTAKLDEAYSNEHTVMLEYLTGDKVGKTISITHSTLKRWWKLVEVEEVKEEDTYLDEELIYTTEDAKAFNKLSKVDKIELSTEEHKLVPMPGIEKLAELKKQYTSIKFKSSSLNPLFILKPNKSDSTNYKIQYNEHCIGELFIRKSFIYVCIKQVISGFEVKHKSYRPYPEYHKVFDTNSINIILKEAI